MGFTLVSASAVLTGVKFEYCPVCGTELDDVDAHILDVCYLCGNQPGVTNESGIPQAEIVRRDLTSRIEDLTESIERHTRAHSQQGHTVDNLRAQKSELDGQLNAELTNYDSAYLSNARELERRIATLQERKLGLQRSIQMLNSITELEKAASRLRERQEELRKEIEAEKNKLSEAGKRIRGIEQAYLEALLAVGVPGISESDMVEVNQKTWMPWIVPREGDAYNFYNAGSGGKKTLLNVCYALAVHRVAAENNLPLPTFLMIDTPMKNIGEDVNRNIFEAFYKYLYSLVTGPLSNKQIIIVDKEYFPPKEVTGVEVLERFMSPDKPLISYYHGP